MATGKYQKAELLLNIHRFQTSHLCSSGAGFIKRKKLSTLKFRFHDDVVRIVDKYKYLGDWFTEHLD